LRIAIDQLRSTVINIEDISRSSSDQQAKVVDLQRRIALKNEFFKQFKNETTNGGGSGGPSAGGSGSQHQQHHFHH
jgi:hypothetical protein